MPSITENLHTQKAQSHRNPSGPLESLLKDLELLLCLHPRLLHLLRGGFLGVYVYKAEYLDPNMYVEEQPFIGWGHYSTYFWGVFR